MLLPKAKPKPIQLPYSYIPFCAKQCICVSDCSEKPASAQR